MPPWIFAHCKLASSSWILSLPAGASWIRHFWTAIPPPSNSRWLPLLLFLEIYLCFDAHREGVQEMNVTVETGKHDYTGIPKISNDVVEAIGFYRLWMLSSLAVRIDCQDDFFLCRTCIWLLTLCMPGSESPLLTFRYLNRESASGSTRGDGPGRTARPPLSGRPPIMHSPFFFKSSCFALGTLESLDYSRHTLLFWTLDPGPTWITLHRMTIDTVSKETSLSSSFMHLKSF